MSKLILEGGRNTDAGHHNYSLPFPFADNKFSEIELKDWGCFNESEQLDLFCDIIRVLEPKGAITFSTNIKIPAIIAEGFTCSEQNGVVRCIHKIERVAASATDITSKYYDVGYFVTDGKAYNLPFTKQLAKWSYRNPKGLWHVAREFAEAWIKTFKPTCVIDVGCGRGVFVKACEDAGISIVKGFDFSAFAVAHAVCTPDKIFQADAKELPLRDNASDLTLVLDFMEHIYVADVDEVLDEIARISKKWVFFNLGGLVAPNKVKMLKRDEPLPEGYEGLVSAGHVTFQTKEWWLKKIEEHGLEVDEAKADVFESLLPELYLVAWEVVVAKKTT